MISSIKHAEVLRMLCCVREDVTQLDEAMQMSYQAQLNEGMQPLELPATCLASKYCGGGWRGNRTSAA